MNFAANLKKYRYRSGYKTAKDMAAKLGIPYNTYAAYESGAREPKYQMLCNIADVLHVTLGQLIGFSPEETDLERALNLARKAGVEVKSYNDEEVTFVNPIYTEQQKASESNDEVLNTLNQNIPAQDKIVTFERLAFILFIGRIAINLQSEKEKIMGGIISRSYTEVFVAMKNMRKALGNGKITSDTSFIQNLDL